MVMESILVHLKGNERVRQIVSQLDKTLFSEYTVRYCSVKEDSVYIIVVSESIDTTMGSRWARAKKFCGENKVPLDVSIVTKEQYMKWVRNSVQREENSSEEWLQRWYKVLDKTPKSGLWAKAADSIYYLKDVKHYNSIAPKILESGYLSLR